MGKRSLKTTAGGVGSILSGLAAIFTAIYSAPGDSLDWSVIAPAVTAGFSGIAAGIGLLFARDNSVSSQDVGIRPAPNPAPNPAAEAAAAEAFRR